MNATRRYSIYNVVYGLPKSGVYIYPVPNEEWACIFLRVSWNYWHQHAWRHWRCSMPALIFTLFYDESLEINWIISNSLLWIKCQVGLLHHGGVNCYNSAHKFPRRYHWSIATLKVTFSFADCKKSGLAVVKEKCLHVKWSLHKRL